MSDRLKPTDDTAIGERKGWIDAKTFVRAIVDNRRYEYTSSVRKRIGDEVDQPTLVGTRSRRRRRPPRYT
jgi:hypothetical protein